MCAERRCDPRLTTPPPFPYPITPCSHIMSLSLKLLGLAVIAVGAHWVYRMCTRRMVSGRQREPEEGEQGEEPEGGVHPHKIGTEPLLLDHQRVESKDGEDVESVDERLAPAETVPLFSHFLPPPPVSPFEHKSKEDQKPKVNKGKTTNLVRPSIDVEARLALTLDVMSGPSATGRYVTGGQTMEVMVGRSPENDLVIQDAQVSGKHLSIGWSPTQRCWRVSDLGSLNGTLLNGDRLTSRHYRLCTDDILQLGTATRLKVSIFPREMLENPEDRSLSFSNISIGVPRSLTMPRHRVPSATTLANTLATPPAPPIETLETLACDELRLECCIASATGRDHARKGQGCEDVAVAKCPLVSQADGSNSALGGALFCVFDGHCGSAAAKAAAQVLPSELEDRVRSLNTASVEQYKDILRATFLATDDKIACDEGSTATALLIWKRPDEEVTSEATEVCLQVANVGDSAALLVDPETSEFECLTEDHRLSNPTERRRLAETGIPLSGGTRRLYGLNLARALGDKFLKVEDLGLSAEPYVSDVSMVGNDRGAIVIIASDGLWDVVDFREVAGLAALTDRQAFVAAAADADTNIDIDYGTFGNAMNSDNRAVDVAMAIVDAAIKAGTRDDVTVLVVKIRPKL